MAEKVYPCIYIEWCDAMSNHSKWISEEELIDWADSEDWIIKQVGFLIKETKEYILLASRHNSDADTISLDACIKIPKTWVRKRKVISS